MKTFAGFLTLLVAYTVAFLVCPDWLEADLLWGCLAALGAGLLIAAWYAAFAFAFRGVGENGE